MNKIILLLLGSLVIYVGINSPLKSMDMLEEDENKSVLSLSMETPFYGSEASELISEATPLVKWLLKHCPQITNESESTNTTKLCFHSYCPGDNTEKIATTLGMTLGAVSPIAHWNLSEDFWRRLYSSELFSIPMATISAIPILTIGAYSTKEEFLKITRNIQQALEKKDIRKEIVLCNVIKKIPEEALKIIGGVCWSIGYAYLDYSYYYSSMGSWCILIVIPTFITSVNVGYWGLDQNVNLFTNFVKEIINTMTPSEEEASSSKMTIIQTKLNLIRRTISEMQDNELDYFINKNSYETIQALFHMIDKHENLLQIDSYAGVLSIKTIVKAAGWFIGTTGAWPTQPLTVEGIQVFLKTAGLSNMIVIQPVAETVAWLSWITMVAVLSYPTSEVFGGIYDSITNKTQGVFNAFTIGKSTIFSLISSIGAVSRVELALRYTIGSISKPIVTCCSAIGRFALNYFTVSKIFSCPPPPTRKQQLLNFIDKILISLPEMNEESIENFNRLIINNNTLQENTPD